MNEVSAKTEVLFMGDVMVDRQYWVPVYPPAGGDVPILSSRISMGGSAANMAVTLGRAGVPCGFCGRIGTDEEGQKIRAQMLSAGLDLSLAQPSEATGYTVTIVDNTGERTMFSRRDTGAPDMTPELKSRLGGMKILLVSGYYLTDAGQSAFALAACGIVRTSGGLAALDPSPVVDRVPKDTLDSILNQTDIILLNERELALVTGLEDPEEGLDALNRRIPCVALKQGKKGAALRLRQGFCFMNGETAEGTRHYSAPAHAVKAIDTTGAGDAFNAGFICSMAGGEAPVKWIESGNAFAARDVVKQGAVAVSL
jgi:ribokinase